MKKFKRFVYFCAKYIGFFSLSSFLFRQKVLVLAYHGFSFVDEHLFLPDLFIRPETLKKRLQLIKKYGFTVIDLDQGMKIYDEDKLPKKSIIITIDDGFYSTLKVALPIFKEQNIHFTLYLTTYYVINNLPIWDLTFKYLLWKSNISLEERVPNSFLEAHGLLEMKGFKWKKIWPIIKTFKTETEKQSMLRSLAEYCKVDLIELIERRSLHLLNGNELLKLIGEGHIIGLHTHRHYVPGDFKVLENEIKENQEIIESIAHYKSQHFCYPSGVYTPPIIKHLQMLSIKTATTTQPGYWTKKTNPYAIPRFLDSEKISQIEFEAELSGFAELLRNIASRFTFDFSNHH
ncbi:MAG: polysaccharide deacetylase family protein [Bacteriovoracaceae bacterium]